MSFLSKVKAQIKPFDGGATYSHPAAPKLPLYTSQALNVPTAGPGTQLQSGPGVQYQQAQGLNQPGLMSGLTPQTSQGLTYGQSPQSQLQVEHPIYSNYTSEDPSVMGALQAVGSQGLLSQNGQQNPPIQANFPASFYRRRR